MLASIYPQRHNDAPLNGLHPDRRLEEMAMELLAGNIVEPGQLFPGGPMGSLSVPDRSRVIAACPDLRRDLREALLEDNAVTAKYPG